MNRIFLLFATIFVLFGCDDGKVSAQELATIRHVVIGGQNLYIPEGYTQFHLSSIGDKTVKIQAMYPGDKPVIEDPKQIWKKSEWYRNVSILFTISTKPDPEAVLEGFIKLFKATEQQGIQYQLLYQTQPKTINNDWDELWINKKDGVLLSFIKCDKANADEIFFPQCTDYFYVDDFRFQVSYDKRLLPDWKTIQSHVISLYESFRSPEAAQSYVHQRLSEITTTEGKYNVHTQHQ